FDYLPEDVLICTVGDINLGAEQFWREVRSRYEDRCIDPQRPILQPAELFLPVEKLFSQLGHHARINVGLEAHKQAEISFHSQPFPDLAIDHRQEAPLAPLQRFLDSTPVSSILFCCDSP